MRHMPPLGTVGRAPDDFFLSHEGDPSQPWYAFIEDDGTGSFYIFWNQSPSFDARPGFDDWTENEETLARWAGSWRGFKWESDHGGRTDLTANARLAPYVVQPYE
jgi:hypothetical protein